MRPDLNTELNLEQELHLTPELKQAIELLAFSSLELEQYIKKKIQSNPLLEKCDSSHEYKKDKDYNLENMIAYKPSLFEYLERQLSGVLNDGEIEVGRFIIGNLDEDGLLALAPKEVAKKFDISTEIVRDIVFRINSLNPAGIAAFSEKEALFAQLREFNKDTRTAEIIVKKHYDLFKEEKYKSILDKIRDRNAVENAVKLLNSLNPYPASGFRFNNTHYIIPDLILIKRNGEFIVQFNDRASPILRISPYYHSLIEQADGEEKEYMLDKLNSAQWFLKSIEHRRITIYRLAKVLIKKQRDFLEKGMKDLHPLTMKEVAQEIDMHESTVSRAVKGKYIQTPRGIYELSFFFSSGQKGFSRVSIKLLIADYIASEDKDSPVSDGRISDILEKEKGLDISRRTVAKYRNEMRIKSSRKRKKYYKEHFFKI